MFSNYYFENYFSNLIDKITRLVDSTSQMRRKELDKILFSV